MSVVCIQLVLCLSRLCLICRALSAQAIIGSVMGASIMFGWPTVLFLMESINYNLDHTSSSRRAWERPKRGVAALFHGAGGAASYADIVCCGLLLLVVVPVFGLGGAA